jgi:hypothetical protein
MILPVTFNLQVLLGFPVFPQNHEPTYQQNFMLSSYLSIHYIWHKRPPGMAVPLLIIVTSCHLTKKSIRNNGKLFVAFIDHSLAFDCEQEPAMG